MGETFGEGRWNTYSEGWIERAMAGDAAGPGRRGDRRLIIQRCGSFSGLWGSGQVGSRRAGDGVEAATSGNVAFAEGIHDPGRARTQRDVRAASLDSTPRRTSL